MNTRDDLMFFAFLALWKRVLIDFCGNPCVIYIYNSVLTCRQNIINSSASAPLDATEFAVRKVSNVDVCMFGPEF